MKTFNIIAIFALLFCIAGCDVNKMNEYENDPAIYFFWSSNDLEQHDSISHTFFFDKNLMQDTIWVRVNAMGKTESFDRPISIVQTNSGKPDAAVSGKHYKPFDAQGIKEKMVIPANKVYGMIPIVVLRDQSLELGGVRLELEVAGNEYFHPGIKTWRNFVVKTTAQAVKPSTWDSRWKNYFGATWGTVKFRFIIEATGYADWETTPADYAYIDYLQSMVRQKLEEYNRNNPGNPLREANGDLVVF